MTDFSLAGIRIVELCSSVAGPYAGTILAQLGAKVVKVERPGTGDDTRQWGPPFWNGHSVMFMTMNAGKSSAEIDLRDEMVRQELLTEIAGADVVLQNWRPGVVEKFGLDYATIRELNPKLIYCDISAFGKTGPLGEEPGYDPLLQAFSGLMSVTGEPGRPPVRVGTSIMDMATGMWAVIGILTALLRRKETGEGCLVENSLLETGMAWLPYQIVGYLATGDEPRRHGSGLPMIAPYEAFETQDDYIVIAAGNEGLWHKLCEAIGRGDLADDERFRTNESRVQNREQLREELHEDLRTRTTDSWISILNRAGVPNSPIQTVGELVEHEQARALEMVVDVQHDDCEGLQLVALPFRMNGLRPQPEAPAPSLGDFDLNSEA